MLKPRSPDAMPIESIPVPAPMSSKTSLLAGLVLGVTVMVGIAGLLAFRDKLSADDAKAKHDNEIAALAQDAAAAVTPVVDAGAPIDAAITDASTSRDARAHH